jgi:hypothetical protein
MWSRGHVHKVLQSSQCIKVNIQQEQKQPKKQLLIHGLDFLEENKADNKNPKQSWVAKLVIS